MNDVGPSLKVVRHRVTRKLELASHSIAKWHEVAQTCAAVDQLREMTSKNTCKCGKYGSFEHLLFLL